MFLNIFVCVCVCVCVSIDSGEGVKRCCTKMQTLSSVAKQARLSRVCVCLLSRAPKSFFHRTRLGRLRRCTSRSGRIADKGGRGWMQIFAFLLLLLLLVAKHTGTREKCREGEHGGGERSVNLVCVPNSRGAKGVLSRAEQAVVRWARVPD